MSQTTTSVVTLWGFSYLWVAVLHLLLHPATTYADVKVTGETTYKPYTPIVLKADGASAKDPAKVSYLWDMSPISGSAEIVEAGNTLYVWASPGSYKVSLTFIDFSSGKAERARFSFTVSGTTPVPPGPGPNPPGPDPPGPKPTPAPINRPGLHVLILYDAENTQLPKGQSNILEGKQVRDWLEANTVADPEIANWKTYWITPHKSDVSKMPKTWQDAFNRAKSASVAAGNKLPWLIVSNGTTGFEGPLPNSPAEFITLAQKYVGAKRTHHSKPKASPTTLRKAG
jgi:hypothetical protein